MAPMGHEVMSSHPVPTAWSSQRTGREVRWLWVAYLVAGVGVVLLTAGYADELVVEVSRGGQGRYVAIAALTVLVVGGIAVWYWRRLPPASAPVPVTAQVLLGLLLAEVAGLSTSGVASAVSALEFAGQPRPADTSFLGFFSALGWFTAAMALLGLVVTLALMRGSRRALWCTVVGQVFAATMAVVDLSLRSPTGESGFLIGLYLFAAVPTVVLPVQVAPLVLAVLPSTRRWTV